ncbi:MAG: hypothetical protein WC725_05560 [Patescibacteria group bacterium]
MTSAVFCARVEQVQTDYLEGVHDLKREHIVATLRRSGIKVLIVNDNFLQENLKQLHEAIMLQDLPLVILEPPRMTLIIPRYLGGIFGLSHIEFRKPPEALEPFIPPHHRSQIGHHRRKPEVVRRHRMGNRTAARGRYDP